MVEMISLHFDFEYIRFSSEKVIFQNRFQIKKSKDVYNMLFYNKLQIYFKN